MISQPSGRHDDVPAVLRWAIVSIKEIGFPVVGCLLMFYMCEVTIGHMRETSEQNTTKIVDALERETAAVTSLRHFLTHKYDD